MAKAKRQLFHLECPECKNRNYTVEKNPDNTKDKLVFNKFCKHCRKITAHKETKIK